METFTAQVMPYINFAITLIVGIGLGLIIRHKNSLIQTLSAQFRSAQELLQLYDVTKFKDYTKMNEEILEMKHKKELEEVFNNAKNSVQSTIQENIAPWLQNYDELLNFHVNMMIDMSDEDRERYLYFMPKNRKFILQMISAIKSGKLKPDNDASKYNKP